MRQLQGEAETIVIERCRPTDPEAVMLLDELSATLRAITGSDGKRNFKDRDVEGERSVFLLVRRHGEAVGCGCLRPLAETVCEIKRMYVRLPGKGIGTALLARLEHEAVLLGYTDVYLETRKVNSNAVNFYLRRGYSVRSNYGPYIGRDEAICFDKRIHEPALQPAARTGLRDAM